MPDDTERDDVDDFSTGFGGLSGLSGLGDEGNEGDADPGAEVLEEDPPSYHSGRVRIIGAEPAGDTVREVTGPVVDDHPELPHWNDAPTGQVPAILDSTMGEEQPVAPPMWREEETDWAAQEESFEPSMLSDDLPAVGALLGERDDEVVDVERQPWHFESDDTLVIPPEPGFGYEPIPEPVPEPEPDPVASRGRGPPARARPGAGDRVRGRVRAGRRRAPGARRCHRRHHRGRRLTPVAAAGTRAQAPFCPHQPEQRQHRPHRQRQHRRHGRPDATCASPSARVCCSVPLRSPASPPAPWPAWSSSASSFCWRRPRPTPPSDGPSTTRPRCSAWSPSCRSLSRPTTRAWRRCRSCSCCSSSAPSSGTWPEWSRRPSRCRAFRRPSSSSSGSAPSAPSPRCCSIRTSSRTATGSPSCWPPSS